jgi:hypothetical protein
MMLNSFSCPTEATFLGENYTTFRNSQTFFSILFDSPRRLPLEFKYDFYNSLHSIPLTNDTLEA